MNRADALAALSSAGLASISHDLDALMKESIRITAHSSDDAALAIGASKLGGEPDLPVGTEWPTGKGQPLSFVAQIRLSDVAPFYPQPPLPLAGMLWFF